MAENKAKEYKEFEVEYKKVKEKVRIIPLLQNIFKFFLRMKNSIPVR